MKLTKLISADIYRDGGSYSASFVVEDGRTYTVWLQRTKMPDTEGLHHRWLFEYFGQQRLDGTLPVLTGSQEERDLLTRLKDFTTDATIHSGQPGEIERLKELIHFIVRREPCFPHDMVNRRFN